MFCYPVVLEAQPEGGYAVTFPDVPEAITQGEDAAEALARAVDALESALSFYIDDRRPLPVPSSSRGCHAVAPGALSCVKLALHQAMVEQGVRRSELARRLHCHMPQVDRLLDLNHASRLEQLETALAALGRRLTVDVRVAA